jgi:hypothetical protein
MAVPYNVEEFVERVRMLHESDYGDFKRKVTLYLSDLESELKTSPEAVRVIREARDRLIYNPIAQVELTRSWLLKTFQPLLKPRGFVS